jgi:ribosomal protein S18 acetylase RimI-like enzyme
MLINLKARVIEDEIQELIGYSVFPDPIHIENAIEAYKTDENLKLFGLESEGEVVGIVGFHMDSNSILTITHIAVKPECRGAGFGRGQILEVFELMKPAQIIAETDEETVDFYRNIGFEIVSLGEKYPGVERFRCTYYAED